ncbi:MAG: hypothetical protein DRO15_06715 [Thermoprotei archaeon]|nr:MAG: hypothetical protein DRO15_06715 [Thermoprotei archaeon]
MTAFQTSRIFKFTKKHDIELVKQLIHVVDAYRVNKFLEIDDLNKDIRAGRIGEEVAIEWKNRIYPILISFASMPLRIEGVKRNLKIRALLRLFKPLSGALAFLFFFDATFGFILPQYTPITPISAILALILFGTLAAIGFSEVFINIRIAKIIDRFFDERSYRFKSDKERLKDFNQRLIKGLSAYYQRYNITDEKEKQIILFNNDYENIEIKKKPGVFKKHYEVIIK